MNDGGEKLFSLLKITVSGYKLLNKNFTIDFVSKAKVSEENDSEICTVDENLYVYNTMAFTGSNSSGKTTALNLIRNCMALLKNGRWIYNKADFSNEKILLHLEFYLNGDIYLYYSEIWPSLNEELTNEIGIPFCKIVNEKLLISKYKERSGKRYSTELKFIQKEFRSGFDDTSALVFLCKPYVVADYMDAFSNTGFIVRETFFSNLNSLDDELVTYIIKLLDNSIEYIKYDNTKTVRFKRYECEEKILSKPGLLSLLSNGTIKGIELYIRVVKTLKNGGYFIIDEIENCFHKNLVNNILFLFSDKKINSKNAKIIFSTHYVEILDCLDRRDNIYIMHKNTAYEIEISNLYEEYGTRTEILKSKQFNNNTYDTLLNYDNLMAVKRLIKHEISNND